jgi:type IV pilus assembly protein PilY1
MPSQGTPLRRALDDVGQYYFNESTSGPWSSTPGTAGGSIATCRQSYAILMTDGYWNTGLAPATSTAGKADNDSTSGSQITGPNGKSYTYTPRSPFSDNRSNTLADVAMYYWKTDLLPNIANNVPTNSRDPAFWQHMVTFGVGLGVTGKNSPAAAFAAIDNTSAPAIVWDNPEDSSAAIAEPAKLDDLLHAAVNSRGDFFSAQNPTQFADSLKSVLGTITKRTSSAASVAANSTRLSTLSKVFSATFNTDNWSGDLSAYPISDSGIASTASWQAASKLPAAAQRKIFSRKSGAGSEFTTSNFSTLVSTDVINYIRGEQSKEKKNGGTLRDRSSLLGDLVHSSPAFDLLTDTVYIGGNDGMLHAFDASTGVERFAYIPGSLLSRLSELTQSTYSHKFFVDGDLALTSTSQNFIDNTYLIGTLGRGGKGLFGLDVTTPASFSAADVKWEYTDGADADLGFMLGRPIIANLNNGQVGVIVGNGYNSTSGKAVLYIFNALDGDLIKKIDTGVSGDNGLATPGAWDEDGDGYVDYIYAGDMKGNVWKFDLTSSTSSTWDSAVKQGATPKAIFTAKDSGNVAQPITAPITVARNYMKSDPNYNKTFLLFGTGAFFRTGDLTDTNTQTWYGLITTPSDKNEALTRTSLKQRTISTETTADGQPARVFSSAVTTPTHDMSGKAGWYIDLLASGNVKKGERMTTASVVYRFAEPTLLASSLTPSASDPCQTGTGYLNAVNAFTGASLSSNFFVFTNPPGSVIGSINLGIGMPSQAAVLTTASGKGQAVASGSGETTGGTGGGGPGGGTLGRKETNLGPVTKGRLSWREILRN